MRDRLRHVYWIGGGSGAGKSTIARCLADQYDLDLYITDDVMAEHAHRMSAEDSPLLNKFIAMDMDERWVNRSPATMLETFHWFKGDGFNLIIEDILRLPKERGIIVEGFRLLPHLVKPLLADSRRAAWLLPTPDFRQAVFNGRGGSAWGFLAKTGNPEKALHNLLERDRLFTNHLREETERLGLFSIKVDSALSEEALTGAVAKAFDF